MSESIMWPWRVTDSVFISLGNVEKRRQRRSRAFVVLTYCPYAPPAKDPAALLNDLFEHSPFPFHSLVSKPHFFETMKHDLILQSPLSYHVPYRVDSEDDGHLLSKVAFLVAITGNRGSQ